jgi:glycerol-1-phosphate dehydrogenase [NAD(P)+]
MKSITHKISIPNILRIGKGAFRDIEFIINDEKVEEVIFILDENMFGILHDQIKSITVSLGIDFKYVIIEPNTGIDELMNIAYSLDQKTEFLVGIGGGSIIDRTKYISYLNKIPWLSVPTSPSNDGFSSPLSSLYINNRRVSVPAKMPYGIVLDIDIIMNCPTHMLISGIGDSVSNITAVYDMNIDSTHKNEKSDDFSAMVSLQSIEALLNLKFDDIRSEKFITHLVESLSMSGIAMEIAGSSKPSSGSEHLISHALDQLLGGNNFPHGIQVGISTYIVSLLQDNRSSEIDKFFRVTGFWDFVKGLGIQRKDLEDAILIAPTIKKNRYTILSDEKNRTKAIHLLRTNKTLTKLFI